MIKMKILFFLMTLKDHPRNFTDFCHNSSSWSHTLIFISNQIIFIPISFICLLYRSSNLFFFFTTLYQIFHYPLSPLSSSSFSPILPALLPISLFFRLFLFIFAYPFSTFQIFSSVLNIFYGSFDLP